MKYYSEEEYLNSQITTNEEFGYGFCWDKRRNQDKELFFLDATNNMRVCDFYPACECKLGGNDE